MTDIAEHAPAGISPAPAAEPRETMRRLPGFLQLPLTLLTGRPYPGQRPVRLSPTFHLATATVDMAVGAALGMAGVLAGGWWAALLLPGWALTLHGMRNLRMMIFHQCSHRNMYNRRRLDLAIGRVVAGLLVVQNFERYCQEHVAEHHAVHHMTLRDPTVQAFLIGLDLHPGMTRRQMWRRLLLGRLLSPRFQARFAWSRLRSFVHGSTPVEKLVAIMIYGGAAAVTVPTGTWPAFLIAWFVPLVPLFQFSNTLRLLVKHTFPAPDGTERRGKEYFAGLTNAIFIGEAAPPRTGPGPAAALRWTRWGLRMLLIHLPSRYLVLTGDTVVHDFHHRHPSSRQWFDYLFARQADIDAGHPGWPAYHHVWGLLPAINLVLDSLSVADPHEFDVARIPAVSDRELFAAFDD